MQPWAPCWILSWPKSPRTASCSTASLLPRRQRIFREVGSAKTDTIFIAGGPHPSGCPEETLEYFDYVVIGEGEETLPELISALNNNGDVSAVKGIAYKDNGKVDLHRRRENVDLDQYPPFKPPLLGPHRDHKGLPLELRILPDAQALRPQNEAQERRGDLQIR